MLHAQCSKRLHKLKLGFVEPLAAVRESTTINVVTVVYFISDVHQSSKHSFADTRSSASAGSVTRRDLDLALKG
jgi:hypothetical protein